MSNPLISAYVGADLFGKVIFASLFLLSVITWTLFLKKWFTRRKIAAQEKRIETAFAKQNPLNFEGKETDHPFLLIGAQLKKQALELLHKNKSATQAERVYLSSHDIEQLQGHLYQVIDQETKSFEKHLFVLSTVVALAPFLGLLGTVWGILLTFNELQTGAGIHASQTIMGGLAMALGTTVMGLVVAIPALLGYNYLRSEAHHFNGELEKFSSDLLYSVELRYRKVEA